MGRFPYNGKMAKSPCGGHPWLCVHPGGGRGELFRAYPIRGSQQPAGWGKVLAGPLEVQADARSGLLVSVLTSVFWAPTPLLWAHSGALSWLWSGTCPSGYLTR